MNNTSPARKSDWNDGFLFVGNHLALDFLNTRPIQDDVSHELLQDFAAVLRWFQAAGLLSSGDRAALQRRWGSSAKAESWVEDVRRWRESLRKQVAKWENGETLDSAFVRDLNRRMALHPMLSRLKNNGETASVELWFEPYKAEDLVAPLAHSAAALFAEVDRKRVRQCGACVLHFYDISKKGTRCWCSMQLCGNRLKVAAYAARQRAAKQG